MTTKWINDMEKGFESKIEGCTPFVDICLTFNKKEVKDGDS